MSKATTGLQLELVPRTLDGNRRTADGASFGAAFYSGATAAIEHRRNLSATWGLRGRGEYALRRFEPEFGHRDRQLLAAESRLEYQLSSRVDLAAIAGIGRVSPLRPAGTQSARRYDYADVGGILAYTTDTWRFRTRVRHRDKAFASITGIEGNDLGRRDSEWRFDATATRQTSDRTKAWIQIGHRTRVSERSFDDISAAGPSSSGNFVRLGTEITFNR